MNEETQKVQALTERIKDITSTLADTLTLSNTINKTTGETHTKIIELTQHATRAVKNFEKITKALELITHHMKEMSRALELQKKSCDALNIIINQSEQYKQAHELLQNQVYSYKESLHIMQDQAETLITELQENLKPNQTLQQDKITVSTTIKTIAEKINVLAINTAIIAEKTPKAEGLQTIAQELRVLAEQTNYCRTALEKQDLISSSIHQAYNKVLEKLQALAHECENKTSLITDIYNTLTKEYNNSNTIHTTLKSECTPLLTTHTTLLEEQGIINHKLEYIEQIQEYHQELITHTENISITLTGITQQEISHLQKITHTLDTLTEKNKQTLVDTHNNSIDAHETDTKNIH